jgi:hypothetical protein
MMLAGHSTVVITHEATLKAAAVAHDYSPRIFRNTMFDSLHHSYTVLLKGAPQRRINRTFVRP